MITCHYFRKVGSRVNLWAKISHCKFSILGTNFGSKQQLRGTHNLSLSCSLL